MNMEKNNEQINDTTKPENATETKPENNAPKQLTEEEHLAKISTGKMTLMKPIRAAGQDITELKWNFRALTGWEYADAMDCDMSGSVFRITNRQALGLFAASAAKETTIKDENGREIHPLDAQDIRQRIGIDDCAKAVQVASVFFLTSIRVGNKRISNE